MDTTNLFRWVYKKGGLLDALYLWCIERGVIVYDSLLLSTNKMASENFKVEVDVQIAILKFFKSWKYLCLPYNLNGYLLINLDSIISWASMIMHVAWSISSELHHVDETILIAFFKFESKSDLGMRYIICKWTWRYPHVHTAKHNNKLGE